MKKIKWILMLCILIAGAFFVLSSSALENPLPMGTKIDRIVVYKEKRELVVFEKEKPLKTYKIALGFEPLGHKEFQGDGKTPEGVYRIDGKNPNSRYHKNLGVSYPNEKDKAYAKKIGKSPGGDIKIHGLPNGMGFVGSKHVLSDWTLGCIAVTSEEIDELYKVVPVGIEVEINP